MRLPETNCNGIRAKYAYKIWLTSIFIGLSGYHLVPANSGEPLLWNRRSVVRAHPTVPAHLDGGIFIFLPHSNLRSDNLLLALTLLERRANGDPLGRASVLSSS